MSSRGAAACPRRDNQSLSPQRIARLRDDGVVEATVVFAPGERAVTLHGYAPTRPAITARAGSAGPVSYAPGTGLFEVRVAPAPDGRAIMRLTLAPTNSERFHIRALYTRSGGRRPAVGIPYRR